MCSGVDPLIRLTLKGLFAENEQPAPVFVDASPEQRDTSFSGIVAGQRPKKLSHGTNGRKILCNTADDDNFGT
jgi:hypothetical protein